MTRWSMIFIAIFGMNLTAWAGAADRWSTCEYEPGRLIVDFAPSINPRVPASDSQGIVRIGIPSLDAIFQEFEVTNAYRLVPDAIIARLKTPPDISRTYVITFRPEYPALSVLDRLASDVNVTNVTPDLIYHAFRAPNDALWGSQWDKRLIGADLVWDVSVGSSDVIMACMDTGTDWNHPDLGMVDPLQPDLGWTLWVNPEEDLDQDGIPYTNTDYPGDIDDLDGIDNGGNGYVDDFLGWDFVHGVGGCAPGEDCDSQMDNDVFGLNPHGTHTGGIMTAHGNDVIGVTGVMWNGRLMSLRAGYATPDGNGLFQHSATLAATYYAAANGARVINMSFGGYGSDPAFQTAINAAWNQGVLIVAASGNNGNTNPTYPAAYQNVIAVNATNDADQLADFSTRGSWTEICAPGADPGIWSTIIDGYGGPSWQGTSMASPNVAGVAGLLWSIFPDYSNADIRDLVLNSAVDISAQNPSIPPSYLGHGRVSASGALAMLFPHLDVTGMEVNDPSGDNDHRLEDGETAQIVFTVMNDSAWTVGTDITVTVSTTDPNLTISNESFSFAVIAPGESVNNLSDPVSVSASNLQGAHWADLLVNFSSPSGYQGADTVQLRVGRGQVLLVDDDGSHTYENYYAAAIERVYLSPDIWSTSSAGDLTSVELAHYQTVVWSCGDESTNTLTASDQNLLTAFLNGGGNLLVVGQNIPEDIGSTSFHTDYLHAQNENLAGNRQLNGIDGNPISGGTALLLLGGSCAGNGTVGPSRIVPINGAEATYNYTEGGVGAIDYAGAYKVAYFSCALEAACGLAGTTHMEIVVENVFEWFGIITGVPPSHNMTIPTALALNGNYPNPFNPTTTLSFDIPATTRVILKVYDALGREAATLIDGPMIAGSHRMVFDGSALASGVYIVRLSAGESSVSSKMMLLK